MGQDPNREGNSGLVAGQSRLGNGVSGNPSVQVLLCPSGGEPLRPRVAAAHTGQALPLDLLAHYFRLKTARDGALR